MFFTHLRNSWQSGIVGDSGGNNPARITQGSCKDPARIPQGACKDPREDPQEFHIYLQEMYDLLRVPLQAKSYENGPAKKGPLNSELPRPIFDILTRPPNHTYTETQGKSRRRPPAASTKGWAASGGPPLCGYLEFPKVFVYFWFWGRVYI